MMNGDLGAIAQNIITYFGGAPGGFIVAAALLVVGLLAAAHFISGRLFIHTAAFGIFAWSAAFIVRQFLGWAGA